MLLTDIVQKQARLNRDKIALIDEAGRVTFGEVEFKANQIAHALQDKGIQKGDRVAVLLYNVNEYIEIYFALTRAGFVIVPLNYRLVAKEFSVILRDSEPKAFIFDSEFLETAKRLKDELDFIENYIALGDNPSENDIDHFETMIDDYPGDDYAVEVTDDDLAMLMYTSGTTGRPKGAMISQKNLSAAIINQFTEITPLRNDVIINFPPLYHMGGLSTFLTHFYRGCTHITIRQFNPILAMEWIQRERPTVAHLVPAMQTMIVNHPEQKNYDLSCIRAINYGASPMLVSQLKQSVSTFGCEYYQIGGLTEVTGHLTTLLPENHVLEGPPEVMKRLGSAGRESMGLRVKIVDLDGNECPPGVSGEEIAKGEAVMMGYWRMPEETEQTIKDDWLHTGDICVKDEDGYIYYVDRIKDMINRGGENVYPREIEEVIAYHPAVMEVAVIGVPDERLGEEIKAVIVARPGHDVSEEGIIEYCRENMASYKRPRSVDFVDELPKNPTGKILKRVLRQSYNK